MSRRRPLPAGLIPLPFDRPVTLNDHIAVHGGDATYSPLRSPDEPCDALPGTPLRIEEYKRRIDAGEELWHADDAPMPNNPDYEVRISGLFAIACE